MLLAIGAAAHPAPAGAADIFQVEFRRCDRLHVGYQNFPDGTVVHWSVTQGGGHVATGAFVTGRGGGYHFLNAKLTPMLVATVDAAVTFLATVNGRTFRATAARTAADPRRDDCKTATRKTPVADSHVVDSLSPRGSRVPGVTVPAELTTTAVTAPPVTAPPVTTSPTPTSLAYTGNGLGALVGVVVTCAGAVLLACARPGNQRARKRRRRRPAPWLCITPGP